ncbi:hypothetical protein A0H81_03672 [Grifola frondosa]|uniref:Uncharacterized protein n=1 Tax=Grifola frondosa TaxID=5627 RepID=A0A1C7MPW6_GRIFR|nr:hypothetical protein A0H81_03672 [Grifola frondosa]
MRDFIPEDAFAGHYTPDYLEEDDYEVYLFWPSSQQYALVHYDSQNYSVAALSDDDDSLDVAEVSPPLSPVYPSVSDFAFPDTPASDDEMSQVGYSRLFRSGLFFDSKSISKRFDKLLAKTADRFRSMKKRFSR